MTALGFSDRAPVRFGTFTTADNTRLRSGRWDPGGLQARGSVVLLGGRKEFIEKYAETAADLNRRGLAVFSFDWRGQGLSGRRLPDRLKGYVRDYRHYVRDLTEFFQNCVQPEAARPVFILAHSMGAHVALRFLHRHPQAVDKAVLVSPMIDIDTKPFPRWLVAGLAGLGRLIGAEEALVPGSDKRTTVDRPFEGNSLTADPRCFAVEKNAVALNPDLALGGVTFAWLSATLASIAHIRRPGYLERIHMPLLMVAAAADRVVSVAAERRACRRLPDCRLVVIPGASHEILMETDTIRSQFWRAFDDFIAYPLRVP
ncbi:MAG: alpha/beta hydrolase [Desulfobacterales bacterium]